MPLIWYSNGTRSSARLHTDWLLLVVHLVDAQAAMLQEAGDLVSLRALI